TRSILFRSRVHCQPSRRNACSPTRNASTRPANSSSTPTSKAIGGRRTSFDGHRRSLSVRTYRSARPTRRTSAQHATACGSSECSTKLSDGKRWALQVAEMPHVRKKGQLNVQSFGELYSHLLFDVEIFLAPNHFHGCLEPGQLRFEVI